MWSIRCWDRLVAPLTLWQAWRAFERGKRRRLDVAAFALDADRHVHALARELRAGRYQPGDYRLILISDPKRRVIAAAPVRDRVVHHAIFRTVAPRFERAFIDHSYACLPRRGSHRALLRFLDGARRHRYAMQLDVRRYFYSIDHEVLRELLFRHLPETPVRELLDRVVASSAGLYQRPDVVQWLGWEAPGRIGAGLPIGNLTSQHWGNLYLDALDHLACRELRLSGYQRYMDDITFFGDDRSGLIAARDRIRDWLRAERRLELKEPEARPRRTSERLSYLGYEVTRSGLRLGAKARGRIPARLSAACSDPRRLADTLGSYAAAWRFGE